MRNECISIRWFFFFLNVRDGVCVYKMFKYVKYNFEDIYLVGWRVFNYLKSRSKRLILIISVNSYEL